MSSTTAVDVDPYVPGHGDLAYDVTGYDLTLDYRVSTNRLDARAELQVLARQAIDRLALDLSGLRVRKVLVDGQKSTAFTQRGNRLHIRLSSPVAAGAQLHLRIRYDGNPRPIGSPWGEVGWEELDDGVIVAGQPSGAPSWFPCNDRPSNKATYRTAITAASEYAVVANGVLTERRVAGSRTTTWVYEQRQPMATYLATVQVGRYFSTDIAGPVPVRLFRPPHLAARSSWDFARQGQMLSAFTEAFGPYPFDGYAVVVTADDLEIPLEAQGLSVFGANHIDGNRTHERLVAHELAHQWFGNSLTVGAWRDIWLHEGFACYAEWLWSERSGGDSAEQLALRHHAVLAARPSDIVLADPGRDHMFDDLVYKRGALTLHALRQQLGDERFFAMLRGWVAQHRYGTVTTDLFLKHWCADTATFDLVEAWLRRPALPDLARSR